MSEVGLKMNNSKLLIDLFFILQPFARLFLLFFFFYQTQKNVLQQSVKTEVSFFSSKLTLLVAFLCLSSKGIHA